MNIVVGEGDARTTLTVKAARSTKYPLIQVSHEALQYVTDKMFEELVSADMAEAAEAAEAQHDDTFTQEQRNKLDRHSISFWSSKHTLCARFEETTRTFPIRISRKACKLDDNTKNAKLSSMREKALNAAVAFAKKGTYDKGWAEASDESDAEPPPSAHVTTHKDLSRVRRGLKWVQTDDSAA